MKTLLLQFVLLLALASCATHPVSKKTGNFVITEFDRNGSEVQKYEVTKYVLRYNPPGVEFSVSPTEVKLLKNFTIQTK